jgi:uncharacterized membrane protein
MTEQNVAQKELGPSEQKPEVLAAQQEINHAEWVNERNWGGPKALAVYFSKKDNRVWVPQQKPSIGWTLNLAHKGGVLWLVGICVGIIMIMVGLSVFVGDLLVRYFNTEI